MVPASPTATMPSTGRPMPVTRKPTMAGTTASPACRPSNGGMIRLPAPKNIENSVMPTNRDCLEVSLPVVIVAIVAPLS